MKSPFISRNDGLLGIDVCIASEIAFLWSKGITTLNSCCGHNKLEASVIVDDACIPKMLALGYQPANIPTVVPLQTFSLQSVELAAA